MCKAKVMSIDVQFKPFDKEGVMKNSKLMLVVAVLAFIMMVGASAAMAADTIKIGVIGPMQFEHGKQHWNGADLFAR